MNFKHHHFALGLAAGIIIGWFFHREFQDFAYDFHLPRPVGGGFGKESMAARFG